MVRHHGRKQTAKRRSAESGRAHQGAVEELKARTATYLVADLPAPDLAGSALCLDCGGTGDTDDRYLLPGDFGVKLSVPAVCRTCGGCGRAEHDGCPPVHLWNDLDDAEEWFAEQDEDGDDDPDGDCPSCHGQRFHFMVLIGEPTAESEAAYAELQRRATTKGLSAWDVDGLASFGELDQVLGAGSQDLAARTDTTVHVRVPCRCAAEHCTPEQLAD